jgi:branched-chain amino acid transport system ATP-binding protein
MSTATLEKPAAATASDTILSLNNIEVIYDHVVLVLKGVSLTVPRQGIVAILGANGAGKTTTLKAISNLLKAERGEVTKGSIVFDGERVDKLSPNELVRRGCTPRSSAISRRSTRCSRASSSAGPRRQATPPAASSRCAPSDGR